MLTLLACASGCERPAPEPPASVDAPFVAALGVSGAANATPSLATLDRLVAAAWSATSPEGTADIYVAVSADAGTTFATPVRVNTAPASVSGEQGPRIALSQPNGTPVVTVLWVSAAEGGRRLLTSESTDGGKTFAEPMTLPGSDAPGMRGWQALGSDGGHALTAVWLDHRRHVAPAPAASGSHQHVHAGTNVAEADTAAAGVAFAQLSDLYVAPLDGSRPAMPVAAGVCYCCKTAVAYGPGGEVFVAWRHVYEGNMRDIALAVSRDGGRTFTGPVRVSEDRWSIAGCPDDGPAMAVDDGDRVHLVWPTVTTDAAGTQTKAVFYAMSSDGRTFSPRVRLSGDRPANHPQIALAGDGRIAVAWDASATGARTLEVVTGAPRDDGQVTFSRPAGLATEEGVYPVLATAANRLLLAWTAGRGADSMIHLTTIP
jgi:hypothetical protein